LEELKYSHSSHPRNPVLAEACFRGGYIDSWGSGIMKIMDACRFAGLPAPEMKEKEGGSVVTLFKDRFTAEQLQQLGLNERQIDAFLFFKTKGEITTSEYMKKYDVAERTAREDLSEIVAKGLLLKKGETKSVFWRLPFIQSLPSKSSTILSLVSSEISI
jgi:ATP-dependent DNA helicase RecG